jgi:hypothetical protein
MVAASGIQIHVTFATSCAVDCSLLIIGEPIREPPSKNHPSYIYFCQRRYAANSSHRTSSRRPPSFRLSPGISPLIPGCRNLSACCTVLRYTVTSFISMMIFGKIPFSLPTPRSSIHPQILPSPSSHHLIVDKHCQPAYKPRCSGCVGIRPCSLSTRPAAWNASRCLLQ